MAVMPVRLLPACALATAAAALAAAAPAPGLDAPGNDARGIDVLVLGDSITAGFGLAPAEAMPARLQGLLARGGRPVRVLAAGVFGDTAEGGLRRLGSLPPARVAVVALGANDLLQAVPPARTEAALHAIVRRLRARGSRVVLAGGRSPFAAARRFDALFARVARAEHVAFAPDLLLDVSARGGAVQADGLHPNAEGASRIAARLAPVVVAALEGGGG